MLVSSANKQNESLSEELTISLMYRRKSNGPKVLPCGIPHFIVLIVDWVSSVVRNCFLYGQVKEYGTCIKVVIY